MNTSLRLLSPLFLLALACGSDSNASGGGASGGKADDLDDDVECAPAEELSLELLAGDKETSSDGDKLTNRVAATCFNASGFENAECCADAGLFNAYREATSCPETVELAKVPGNASAQRCRNASNGQFVDAACCSDLCDPAARRNSGGACIDSGGKFEDEMCCFLAASLEAASCSGATWETVSIEGTDRDVCRGENGKFAMNSCCAAECVQAVSADELSLQSIPAACDAKIDLEAPLDECPADARPNAGGLCHNPADGRFVKAACCETLGVTACTFDTVASFGAEFSSELVDGLGTDTARIERADLSALQTEQLGITALHLGFLVPGQESDLDALFDVPDGDEFFYASGEIAGVAVDWVQFFAGDTEVGVVFDQGTNRIIAEVGDGEILGCTAG
jgi:hypothetical protein